MTEEELEALFEDMTPQEIMDEIGICDPNDCL